MQLHHIFLGLPLLVIVSGLTLTAPTHELQTMNHEYNQIVNQAYSSGTITTDAKNWLYNPFYRGFIPQQFKYTCSYSRKCGSSHPCCPCEVPEYIGILTPGMVMTLQTAFQCTQNYVMSCMNCRQACGLFDLGSKYSNPQVCQSSQCTSNPQYNRTDCGIV